MPRVATGIGVRFEIRLRRDFEPIGFVHEGISPLAVGSPGVEDEERMTQSQARTPIQR